MIARNNQYDFLGGDSLVHSYNKRRNKWETHVIRRSWSDQFARVSIGLLVFVYLLNALILQLFSVYNTPTSESVVSPLTQEIHQKVDGQVPTQLHSFDNIPLTGALLANIAGKTYNPDFSGYRISGYVNLMSSDQSLYLDSADEDTPTNYYMRVYLISHEQGHINQKQVAANASLGFPSYTNPIKTIAYSITLHNLSKDLSAYKVEFKHKWDNELVLHSLESNAECAAVANTGYTGLTAFMNYSTVEGCNVDSIAAAITLRDLEWPTPENVESHKAEAQNILNTLPSDKTLWVDSLYNDTYNQ